VLWEIQYTEIEAVHLAITLVYHGLLCVPAWSETCDMTPRMSYSLLYHILNDMDL